ncbi:hypothetical protein EZJ55_19780 [Microcystis aeruginosa EAWAG127a]|uniref:Uncharacterized protein n=1 Tax=Microcystis aeruginosa EAWAG127a TaxID=2529855 RepID=A0A5J5LYJ0_MICAE|nr:hypothetical protein EZJ55_19780 [Microcystis aeruginosa EAWAG127a]
MLVSTITNFVTDKRIYLDYFCKRSIELPVVRGYSAALSSVSLATPLIPDSLCTLTALLSIHTKSSF